MKNLALFSLFILSIILIFLSQKTFYSSPIKTVYKYDGSYKVGGDRYDKNDKKLESFTYHSYLNNGRLVVEEVDFIYYTFWGKVRGSLFILSIISSVIIILILFNKEKYLKNIKNVKLYEYVIKPNVKQRSH